MICCDSWTIPVKTRCSTGHGYGNSLIQFDPEHVEGLALERGGLGVDGDRGLVLGEQNDLIEGGRGEVSQQGRKAVASKPSRVVLVAAWRRARAETRADSPSEPWPSRRLGTAAASNAAACATPRNGSACAGTHARAKGPRWRRGSVRSRVSLCLCGRHVPRPRGTREPPRP